MEVNREKAFPRGGHKSALFKNRKGQDFSLIPHTKHKKNKKAARDNTNEENEEVARKKPFKGLEANIVEELKPSEIHNEMIILGIVCNVYKKKIGVSLPGKLNGVIGHVNVSQQYKTMIENTDTVSKIPSLQELFQVGNVLPVKILEVSKDHPCLELTCDPKSVNQRLTHDLIQKGMVLSGSVVSKEDHGYIIDFGIENLKAFLHFDNVESDTSLIIGQIIRCCVVEYKKSLESSHVQLSALKSDIQSSTLESNSLPIYCFVSGLQLKLTVEKVLADGVEVSYGYEHSTKAYIYEDHLGKKFPNLLEIEVGREYIGTLLYVKPLVNFLYFKIMPTNPASLPFKYGDVVSGRVIKSGKSGVMFKIEENGEKAKCFVPISKLRREGFAETATDISNKYPVKKKVAEIRLGNFNYMNRFYIGSTDKASLNDKYYSYEHIKYGDILDCQIEFMSDTFARLAIGKTTKGTVDFHSMTDVPLSNPTTKFKVGQRVKAKVLEVVPEAHFVRLTMKPSLIKEERILYDADIYDKNVAYLGTIICVKSNSLIVSFFNGVRGIVYKNMTPFADSSSLKENYCCGQLVKCYVIKSENKKLVLSLLGDISNDKLNVGQKYKVTVTNKTEKGLFVDVELNKKQSCKGYLPKELLSMHWSLCSSLLSTYDTNDTFFAYCVSNSENDKVSLFGNAEVLEEFYEGKNEEDLQSELVVNAVLPFLFNTLNQKGVLFVNSILPGKENMKIKVLKNDVQLRTKDMTKYRILYGKVLSIAEDRICISTKLADVWNKNFNVSLSFLDSYLLTVEVLIARQKKKMEAYSENLVLGSSVKGVIEEVRSNAAVIKTENGDLGMIEGRFKVGDEVCGKVAWIDPVEQIIHVRQTKKSKEDKKEGVPFVPENDHVRGKVIFINEETVVLDLKGRASGNLGFHPRRRHLNDFILEECVFKVGDDIKLWVTKKNSHILAVDRKIASLTENVIWKSSEKKLKDSVESLKKKLSLEKKKLSLEKKKKRTCDQDVEIVSEKIPKRENKEIELPKIKKEEDICEEAFQATVNDIPRLEYDDIDIKSEEDTEEPEKKSSSVHISNDERILLSSSSESEDEETSNAKKPDYSKPFNVGFNWEAMNNYSLLSGVVFNKTESSDDDDEGTYRVKNKVKILTASEKRDKAKGEEERLRFIEERLMDKDREPETADDFDRAVLGNPNSSALWLKYMAFHIQGTEIDKARAVARRALKAISFREEQEKLNIWIALLNLENIYGNEDSLNKTLTEALQSNDPYKIHLHMLNVHGQSNKLQDMEKLGNFIVKKYKNVDRMWYDVALAFFTVGKVESARNVLQKALAVVEKNLRITLITKFSQLENKYGSPERAQTLYESVLASFPKRVDVWCSYVDMLVKSNHIDLARQVLERATSQSLRPRKMKTLFKKFISFEETHGTPENIEKVREAAVEYVQTVGAGEE